jgi:hypothetical protein
MEIRTKTLAAVLAAGCLAAGCAAEPPRTDLLEARLTTLEEKVGAWPKERANLSSRIYQTDKSATNGVRRARAENTALVEGLRRETNRNVEPMQARLTTIESTERERQDEIIRLREELIILRRDLDDLISKSCTSSWQ